VSKTFGGKGIRALDRDYDALVYYEYFLKVQEKFIISRKTCEKVNAFALPSLRVP